MKRGLIYPLKHLQSTESGLNSTLQTSLISCFLLKKMSSWGCPLKGLSQQSELLKSTRCGTGLLTVFLLMGDLTAHHTVEEE